MVHKLIAPSGRSGTVFATRLRAPLAGDKNQIGRLCAIDGHQLTPTWFFNLKNAKLRRRELESTSRCQAEGGRCVDELNHPIDWSWP